MKLPWALRPGGKVLHHPVALDFQFPGPFSCLPTVTCWRTLKESCKGLGSVSLKINNQHTHRARLKTLIFPVTGPSACVCVCSKSPVVLVTVICACSICELTPLWTRVRLPCAHALDTKGLPSQVGDRTSRGGKPRRGSKLENLGTRGEGGLCSL